VNGPMGALEERIARSLERRADDIEAPISLPLEIRSRIRRRRTGNLVVAGGLVVTTIVGVVLGVRALDRSLLQRQTGRVPVDATQANPAIVASGATETVIWHVDAWPMPDGRISTSLWWGAGGQRFLISERVLETDRPLDLTTYLPIELVAGVPASGIAWGTFATSASSVRLETGGCPAMRIDEAQATWLRVGSELVGVWAATTCSSDGEAAALDGDGVPSATQALAFRTAPNSVIGGTTVGGDVWSFRRIERLKVRTPGGEKEPAVVISLSAGPSGGSTQMYAFPSAPPTEFTGLGSQPNPEQGRHFYFSFAPADVAVVLVALPDGGPYEATLASNLGDEFTIFFGEVPAGLQGATIVAYDSSCNEVDRMEFAAPADAIPAPPCPGT
jgi:hypothetical protein